MGMWVFYRGISQCLLDAVIGDPRLILGMLALGKSTPEERYAEAAEGFAHLPDDQQDEALRSIRTLESLRDCFPAELKREAWGLRVLRRAGFSDRDLQPEVNIEKRWRSLRDLLDAERLSTRLGYVITGGAAIGEDLGYGPARYLTSAEVLDAWRALVKLGADEVAGLVPEDDLLDYYSEALDTVRGAYRDAAAREFAMLLHFG
jgi:hypothetical protein